MPVQTCDVTPWEWLLDAEAERQESLRGDDPFRQAAALADYEAAREAVRCLGALLVLHGAESREVQKRLGAVFNALAKNAHEAAQAARKRADWAVGRLDALAQRVRELELALADRTAGVGQPGRVA